MCDPKSNDCRCKRLSNQINSTLENISNLIARAIKDPSIRHKNDNLLKCWEVKNCSRSECPAYENENLRCWQLEGTHCGAKIQGAFAQKYENCVQCKVFQAACSLGSEAINEQVNNLLHLLYEKEKQGQALNKELIHALKNLNRKEQKILDLSARDNLTGLYSKKYLLEHLVLELERFKRYRQPFSLLMIDIDGFQRYNETFGHLEGDLLLKKFGGLIKKLTRKIDIASRFGSDEFLVILPNTEQKTALLAAKRLLHTLKQQTLHPKGGSKARRESVSIGLSTAIPSDDNPGQLIERAQKAMQQAKRDGGDRIVIFSPPLKAVTSAA